MRRSRRLERSAMLRAIAWWVVIITIFVASFYLLSRVI